MEGLNMTPLQSLQSKDQAALLDTVDEIRRQGVYRYISLPQIIVCGDQSSGKSSVLEAISGVQFPVNDGLCTRFTTEVILRRSSKDMAVVKLIPSKDANPSHREKLEGFKKSSVSHSAIPNLISEAKNIMGLTGSSTFSRDTLQLEVSGPKLPHLTLVDLPGLIHNATKEQTDDDVRIPRELVRKYMDEPRSIVLAIITAKNDTSNQVVLEMAKGADPQGARTMGIITKPDCLLRDSPNESAFFDLASNKDTYFKLGWHVLRNGDYNERKDPSFDRDVTEKEFFSSGVWKGLPVSNRGIDALRTRLSHVLYEQIQRELPSLIEEIDKELEACNQTLSRLGSARDTPESQRKYLSQTAERFHDLVKAGSEGAYRDEFFSLGGLDNLDDRDIPNNRLRANVRRAEHDFVTRMHDFGHTYQLLSPFRFGPPKDGVIYISEEEWLQKIRLLVDKSKGQELPTTSSPLLVGDLFREQSQNWRKFAIEFAEDVWELAKEFLDDVLAHVADESVREAALEQIIDPAMDDILLRLREKVAELLSPYTENNPITLNPRFVREKAAQRKLREECRQRAQSEQNGSGLFASSGYQGDDPDTQACEDLFDLMQAYYALAIDVFIDNVANLGVENCLMRELKNMLSSRTVTDMDDEMLETIASESEDVRQLRDQTLEKQSSLQKSLHLCTRQNRQAKRTTPSARGASEAKTRKPTKKSPSTAGIIEGVNRVNISPSPPNPAGVFRDSYGVNDPSHTDNGINSVNSDKNGSAFGSSSGKKKKSSSKSGGSLNFNASQTSLSNSLGNKGNSSLFDPSWSASIAKNSGGFGSSSFGSSKGTSSLFGVDFSYLDNVPDSSKVKWDGNDMTPLFVESNAPNKHYHHMAAMRDYENYSQEEVRLKDYLVHGLLA